MVESYPLDWPTIRRLQSLGVSRDVIKEMAVVRTVRGRRAPDGWFEPDPTGAPWLAFFEETADDLVSPSRRGIPSTWEDPALAY